MGEVYRAIDSRLNRTVAIKCFSPRPQATRQRERFRREARTISSLNHPHICTIYDVGQHNGVDYLVMSTSRAKRWPRGSAGIATNRCP